MDNLSPQKVYMIRSFRYNCRQSQLNSEGGGELHEIIRS